MVDANIAIHTTKKKKIEQAGGEENNDDDNEERDKKHEKEEGGVGEDKRKMKDMLAATREPLWLCSSFFTFPFLISATKKERQTDSIRFRVAELDDGDTRIRQSHQIRKF